MKYIYSGYIFLFEVPILFYELIIQFVPGSVDTANARWPSKCQKGSNPKSQDKIPYAWCYLDLVSQKPDYPHYQDVNLQSCAV